MEALTEHEMEVIIQRLEAYVVDLEHDLSTPTLYAFVLLAHEFAVAKKAQYTLADIRRCLALAHRMRAIRDRLVSSGGRWTPLHDVGEVIHVKEGAALTLGRSSMADLKVKDNHLSRIHVALEFTGAECTVVDLNSFLPAGYMGAGAYGIDQLGNVYGRAQASDGAIHAAVWLVPEPSSLFFSGVVSCVLLLQRRKTTLR